MRRRCSWRWRLAAAALVVLGSPVALGSVASAGSLATLHATPFQVQPGGTVLLLGKNYSSSASSSNIEIRLDGRQGPVLASFSPRSSIGQSSTYVGDVHVVVRQPITIPVGTSLGNHTLVAIQHTQSGNLISGAPGRASIEVVASASAASQSMAGSPVPTAPASVARATSWLGGTRFVARDPVSAAVALLSLVATTLVLVARNRHRAPRLKLPAAA